MSPVTQTGFVTSFWSIFDRKIKQNGQAWWIDGVVDAQSGSKNVRPISESTRFWFMKFLKIVDNQQENEAFLDVASCVDFNILQRWFEKSWFSSGKQWNSVDWVNIPTMRTPKELIFLRKKRTRVFIQSTYHNTDLKRVDAPKENKGFSVVWVNIPTTWIWHGFIFLWKNNGLNCRVS